MIFKVKILQCPEEHFLFSSEFCMFLVGLCDAGRKPILHITSSRVTSDFISPEPYFDYSVIIEYGNSSI